MIRTLCILILAIVPLQIHAHGSDPHDARNGAAPPAAADVLAGMTAKQRAARLFFSDRKLVTQRGETVAFYSDVLRDRIVLIDFIYTECTDSCPTQTARLAAVQSLLGQALARRVSLVSISVDPEHDTPPVLADYAARFGARDGWMFLTGTKSDVDEVVRRLGQLAPSREAHTTLFVVGNTGTGHWDVLHPDTSPDGIVRRLRALAAESLPGDAGQ